MSDLDTENSWNFFMNKVKYCIDNYVPGKSNNKNLINQNGWTNIVSEKLRKSIMPGNVLHIVIVIEITKNIVNCEIVLQKL